MPNWDFKSIQQLDKSHAVGVVLGLSETGLAVARSLGRKGVKVVGVHFGDERTPAELSRYIHFIRGPEGIGDSDKVDFLLALSECFLTAPVLLPTGDQYVLLIHKNRTLLEKNYKFYIWDSQNLEHLISKRDIFQLAKQAEIPLPKTAFTDNWESLMAEVKALEYPFILKPEYTHLWLEDAARGTPFYGKKALPIASQEELESIYALSRNIDPRFIVQELVVGPDENHIEYGVIVTKTGRFISEFVGRKLRLTPPYYGMGCFVVSDKDAEVVKTSRNILQKLGYKGIAQCDYKRDSRNGKLYFFEINPRFTVWTSLQTHCGMDLPYFYYQLCTECEPQVPTDYKTGVYWLNHQRDINSFPKYWRNKTWTIWRWLKSLLLVHVEAYYCKGDLRPGFFVSRNVVYQLLNKIKQIIFR